VNKSLKQIIVSISRKITFKGNLFVFTFSANMTTGNRYPAFLADRTRQRRYYLQTAFTKMPGLIERDNVIANNASGREYPI